MSADRSATAGSAGGPAVAGPARGAPLPVEIEELRFGYPGGPFALDIPKLRIAAGSRMAIVGPSGSGKTTLLHLIAGILTPQRGSIRLGGVDLAVCSDGERRRRRIESIGLIFQEFELLDYLSVRENILLPYRIHPALCIDRSVEDRAHELARRAGLAGCVDRRPARLSHGERQRTAICRALLPGPALLLADEPTGNLDPQTTQSVLDLLFAELQAGSQTLVLVTHDHGLLGRFDRVIDLAAFLLEEAVS